MADHQTSSFNLFPTTSCSKHLHNNIRRSHLDHTFKAVRTPRHSITSPPTIANDNPSESADVTIGRLRAALANSELANALFTAKVNDLEVKKPEIAVLTDKVDIAAIIELGRHRGRFEGAAVRLAKAIDRAIKGLPNLPGNRVMAMLHFFSNVELELVSLSEPTEYGPQVLQELQQDMKAKTERVECIIAEINSMIDDMPNQGQIRVVITVRGTLVTNTSNRIHLHKTPKCCSACSYFPQSGSFDSGFWGGEYGHEKNRALRSPLVLL